MSVDGVGLGSHALRLFVAVAEQLHFGRAARALGMTQPPLSQQIQRLEERLGGALFHRTRRVVRLTALGQAMLPDAKRILAQLDQLQRRGAAIARGELEQLRVATVGPALDLVAPAIGMLRRQRAQLGVQLQRMGTAQQLAALRDGTLDVGVGRLFAHDVTDMVARVVWEEDYVLAIPETDPLAGRRVVRLGELVGRPLLLFPRATHPALYDAIVAVFADQGLTPDIAFELDDKRDIIAVAAAQLGVGLVPQSSAAAAPPGVRFVRVHERRSMPRVQLSLITPAADDPRPVRAFVDALASVAKARRTA